MKSAMRSNPIPLPGQRSCRPEKSRRGVPTAHKSKEKPGFLSFTAVGTPPLLRENRRQWARCSIHRFFLILPLLLTLTPQARAEDTPPVVLQNEFIKMFHENYSDLVFDHWVEPDEQSITGFYFKTKAPSSESGQP